MDDKPITKTFRILPENASMEQIIHSTNEVAVAYANVAHTLTKDVPRILGIIEDFRNELVLQGTDIRRLHDRVDVLERHTFDKRINTPTTSRPQPRPPAPRPNPGSGTPRGGHPREERPSDRPPPRPESDSSHDLAKHVSQEIIQRIEAEVQNPQTPPPDSAKVAAIQETVMAAAITKIKAQQWDDLQTERKANARELTKFKYAAYGTSITTVITIAGWITEHFLK